MVCDRTFKIYGYIFSAPLIIYALFCSSIGTGIVYNIIFGYNITSGIKNTENLNCTKPYSALVCDRSTCSLDSIYSMIKGCFEVGIVYLVLIIFATIIVYMIVAGLTELLCCNKCCRKKKNNYHYLNDLNL